MEPEVRCQFRPLDTEAERWSSELQASYCSWLNNGQNHGPMFLMQPCLFRYPQMGVSKNWPFDFGSFYEGSCNSRSILGGPGCWKLLDGHQHGVGFYINYFSSYDKPIHFLLTASCSFQSGCRRRARTTQNAVGVRA